MSVNYERLFPTGYTANKTTLRSEFITDFSTINYIRIPDVLSGTRGLFKAVVDAHTAYLQGKAYQYFRITWACPLRDSDGVDALSGPDLVNIYNTYVANYENDISLLLWISDEAYDNFHRYIRIKATNPQASVSYNLANEDLIQ